MAEEQTSSQERTERATPRRRQQARDEGQVARSPELSASAAMLAGTLMLSAVGGTLLAGFAVRTLQACGRTLASGPLNTASAVDMLRGGIVGLTLALLPFTLGVVGTILAVNLAQARGVLSWKPLEPKLSHLNPWNGVKRILSPEAAFTLVKSLAKLLALGCVTWLVLSHSWPEMTSLARTGPAETMMVLRALMIRLAIMTGLAFLVIALVDYLFQRFRLEKRLRMTRQEVVREFRETEGDPMVKARILSLMRARARQRMLQQVPKADVVIVNPTEIAVALKYDLGLAPAPVVVAMGRRKLAERIKALAIASNVPVLENRPVARALIATATLGKAIPPALYAAVAEILAFVYRQRALLPEALRRSADRRSA